MSNNGKRVKKHTRAVEKLINQLKQLDYSPKAIEEILKWYVNEGSL